jgi:hypothetical protein
MEPRRNRSLAPLLWAGVVALPLIALSLVIEAAHATNYPASGRAVLRVCAAVLLVGWVGFTGLAVTYYRRRKQPPNGVT